MSLIIPADRLASSTDPAAAELRVEPIETAAQFAELATDWRALERAAGNTFPFRTHEWMWCWWQNFSDDRRSLRDSLFIQAIRTASGELVGVAPLMMTEKPAVGPFRVRILQFIGPDGYLTEMAGLLCLPELEAEVYRALLRSLCESAARWDFLLWAGLRPASPAAALVEGGGRFRWISEAPNYRLPLAPTWDEFRSRLPRNVKESLRKGVNSLKRDGHQPVFEAVRSGEGIGAALDSYFRLHKARADLRGTVRHKDFFSAKRARRFIADVCARMASRGAARLFLLRVDGTVVAARLGFVLEGSLYLYYSGFDPAYARYGVMTTLVAEAIRSAIGDGLREVNLSFGNDVSKTRWRPTETFYREALQLSPSPRAPFALFAYKALRSATRLTGIRNAAARYLWRRGD